jgi:hypothetical protein
VSWAYLFLRLTPGTLPSHVLLDTGGSDARVFNLKVIIIQGSFTFQMKDLDPMETHIYLEIKYN